MLRISDYVSDPRVEGVGHMPAVWASFLLERACDDGPAADGNAAAPLPSLRAGRVRQM